MATVILVNKCKHLILVSLEASRSLMFLGHWPVQIINRKNKKEQTDTLQGVLLKLLIYIYFFILNIYFYEFTKIKIKCSLFVIRCNQVWGSFNFGNEQIVGKETG